MKLFYLPLVGLFLCYSLTAQSRYSLGTDYAYLLYYPQKFYKRAEPVIQFGIAATREISLKSNVVLGSYYYQTNTKISDSLIFNNNYLEMPVSIKMHYSIFDKVFQGHMTSGIGLNMLLQERGILKDTLDNALELKGESLKPDAVNVFWGIGFDLRINRSFYLSFDGLLKGFYFFSTTTNDTGRKLAVTPMTKAGIFVWLNSR